MRYYEITFSERTPTIRNRLGQNFTRKRRPRWHTSLQTFGALRQTGAKCRRKNAFCEFFVTETTDRSAHFPIFLINLNTKHELCCHEFFQNKIANSFPVIDHLPTKILNLNLGVFSAHFPCARSSLGLWVYRKLSIVSYSDFFLSFYRFQDGRANSPHNFGNFAKFRYYFGCCYSVSQLIR